MLRDSHGFFKSTEEKMEDFLWLVNTVPHVVPKRVGEVEALCPAIVYSDSDEETQKLYLGNQEDLLTAFPHEGIAEVEASVSYRRISAVTILGASGVYLAVDSDKVERRGGLEVVQAAIGDEFDEIFIGGFSEYPDYEHTGASTLCTTGLIREVSKFSRLAANSGFNLDQTELALSISISQLSNGMPMGDLEVIEFVKMAS